MRLSPNLRLILGGPGCGKTTRLLRVVEEALAAGVPSRAIAYVAFTKAAATEARARAAERFGLDPQEDLPWFRTIHSLAYARLGVTRDEMLSRRDWAEFSELVNEPMMGTFTTDAPVGGERYRGDQLLRVTDYAATARLTLEEAWSATDEAVSWPELKRFDTCVRRYKDDVGKFSFTDLLTRYADEGAPLSEVRVAVVDEAQDLTAAQWAVVARAFPDVEQLWVCGDDDQAIYEWAGADVRRFLSLSDAPEVLPTSYRLPRPVHEFSASIASRISRRYVKPFNSTDKPGGVYNYLFPEDVDLHAGGTWLLLARHGYMLDRLEAMARDQGVIYTVRDSKSSVWPEELKAMRLWERLRSGAITDMTAVEVRLMATALGRPVPQLRELTRYTCADLGWPEPKAIWHVALTGIPGSRRDYYVSCLRRGEKLGAEPRVHINTIHGVKGRERDNVLLMTDITERVARGAELRPDAEHRVFYVGATRSLSTLHIVEPQGGLGYKI